MRILTILLCFILFLGCKKDKTPPVVVTPPKELKPEVTTATRGVWIANVQHTDLLASRANMETWLTTLSGMGFNTVFVVVYNSGRTIYPSKVMKNLTGVEQDERFVGRDPLREISEVAKAKNMKVYAWFEYGFATDYGGGQGREIINTKPAWGSVGVDGQLVVKNSFTWLNSLHPEVQNFMLSLLMEVVENYDLTGIQGDDRLPAMPTEAGYDTMTTRLYKAAKGVNPPTNPKDADWVQWRADNLSQFMKRIYTSVKAKKPNMLVSMSPSPYPFGLTEYLQDWPAWVKNGWVDMVVPQCYRYDEAAYIATLAQQIGYLPADKKDIFFPGVLLAVGKTYTAPSDLLAKMVSANRSKGITGEVYFYNDGVTRVRSFFDYVYKK
jgi:uncharacterized lipoprotein YddW (UPF0748 family)